jgi:hypothetical protein
LRSCNPQIQVLTSLARSQQIDKIVQSRVAARADHAPNALFILDQFASN